MTDRPRRSMQTVTRWAMVAALGSWCSLSLASNGIKSNCTDLNNQPVTVRIPAPSLTVTVVDHGLTDAAADMKESASEPSGENIPTSALADAVETDAVESSDSATQVENIDEPIKKTPETALHLPGVPEEDQPRFRRQMYRNDI